MSQKVLLVEKERFLLDDSKKYMITAFFQKKIRLKAFLMEKFFHQRYRNESFYLPGNEPWMSSFQGANGQMYF